MVGASPLAELAAGALVRRFGFGVCHGGFLSVRFSFSGGFPWFFRALGGALVAACRGVCACRRRLPVAGGGVGRSFSGAVVVAGFDGRCRSDATFERLMQAAVQVIDTWIASRP